MPTIRNIVFGIAKNLPSIRNTTLVYEMRGDRIYSKFVRTDSEDYVFDADKPNLYVAGYANPIGIDTSGLPRDEPLKEKNLIPSRKYKQYMGLQLVQWMFSTQGDLTRTLKLLIVANIGLTLLMGIIIIVLVG